MRMAWKRMDSYLKALIVLELSVILACSGLVWYSSPHRVKAASQFANILCDGFTPVSTAVDVQVITAGGPNNFIYICSYNFNAVAADVFSIVEGTGSVCGTGTKAMVGATTAAAGLSLTTGGSINYGGGSGVVTKTTVAGNNVCILRTTAGPLSGVIGFTQGSFF